MLEAISKNWGYLTTIGAIVAVAFGTGIWMKGSLDTLDTLPGKFEAIDEQLKPLKNINDTINQATCVLEAQMEMSKNEVMEYTVNLKIKEIEEQVFLLENLDSDFTDKQKRKYQRLQKINQELNSEIKEFQSKYDKYFEIYDDCQ